MKAHEKTWKEQDWMQEDQNAWWEEFSGVKVSDKMVVEEALEMALDQTDPGKFQFSFDFLQNLTWGSFSDRIWRGW